MRRGAVVLGAPGQDLERGGIREGQHVRLVGRGEALNGGTVEANALFKRDLEVLRLMAKLLSLPSTSVNHRRMKRMSRSSTVRRTKSMFCCWSICEPFHMR